MKDSTLYQEALDYFNGYSSITELRYPVLMALKKNIESFALAICVLERNPNASTEDLERETGFKFNGEHLEILGNFMLRDILQDRRKEYNKQEGSYAILSPRQLYRRTHREATTL